MEQEGLPEAEALLEVYPNDRNRRKNFRRWKKNGLWPVPSLELQEHGTSQSAKASESDINSDIHCYNSSVTEELSEKALLLRLRGMLDKIEVIERVGLTAPNRKSPLKTTMIAIRVPESLDEELKALKGPKSRHIEKAIILYVKAMKVDEGMA
jgi:hypothetical protein